MDERQPDLSEDPRHQESGRGGYPESAPGEQVPGGDGEPDRDTSGAPSESSPEKGDAGQSTGNPGAAG